MEFPCQTFFLTTCVRQINDADIIHFLLDYLYMLSWKYAIVLCRIYSDVPYVHHRPDYLCLSFCVTIHQVKKTYINILLISHHLLAFWDFFFASCYEYYRSVDCNFTTVDFPTWKLKLLSRACLDRKNWIQMLQGIYSV